MMKPLKITPEVKYISIAFWVRWRRPFIHFWKYYELKFNKKNLKILDLGCGIGYSLYDKDPHYTILGIELVSEVVDKSLKEIKSDIIQADATMLPFRDSVFDVVSAFDLLEHVPNPELVINEAYRVLRKGGYFIFTTPSKVGVSLDPTHISEREPHEWEKILRSIGFVPKMYYVPALITIYLLIKIMPKAWKRLRLINATSILFKVISLFEEPLRRLLGVYYGRIKTRLYVEAKKA